MCTSFLEQQKRRIDKLEKTKLRGRIPQANYTDRATAACRRRIDTSIYFNIVELYLLSDRFESRWTTIYPD
jgi:hypothetical protein